MVVLLLRRGLGRSGFGVEGLVMGCRGEERMGRFGRGMNVLAM